MSGHNVTVSEPPPAKWFRHLDKVLQVNLKEKVKSKSKLPLGKVEVDRYFDSTDSLARRRRPYRLLAQSPDLLSSIELSRNRYPDYSGIICTH